MEQKLTAYELNKNIIHNLEPLDIKDKKIREDLIKQINHMILNNKKSKYFALCAPYIRYITIFHFLSDKSNKQFAEDIVSFIEDEISGNVLGPLKDYGYRKEEKHFEIWLGDECYLLFDYSKGVEEL